MVEPQRAEKAVDLNISVRRPNTDVIAMLVGNTGPFSAEFDVYTVPVRTELKELLRDGNGRGVGVLCIVDALGPGKRTSGKFT